MSKLRSENLYGLIKSMRKSEKRYFKLQAHEQNGLDPKFIRLFNALDQQSEFDENQVLAKNSWLKKEQFSNLKAHLYRKILQSLKNYAQSTNDEISIRENIDYVQLLFDRSLHIQSMQLLQKVKKTVKKSENLELLLEVLKWERNLLPYTIGKNNQERVRQIVEEANDVNERIFNINTLTNLSVGLNATYVKTGYIRDKSDFEEISEIFKNGLPALREQRLSLRERLLWYEIHINFYGYTQDLENYYAFAGKLVELFPTAPNNAYLFEMYLKGLNHLLNAQSRLVLSADFFQTHKKLKALANHRLVQLNENIQIRLFKYSYAHQFNGYIMLGDFKKGVALIRKIESRLEGYIGMLDKHSELVLFYKIACLYFGNGNYRDSLKWLNRIINYEEQDIREDVHSFARIVNLVTHYELGNRDVIDYYVRSTYRYLHKREGLQLFQKYILDFIRNLSADITETELVRRFKKLREDLLPLANSRYDSRAFVYFDIISWLESKIQKKPVEEIVKEKVALNAVMV